MISSLCYEVQEEDGKQCERDDTSTGSHSWWSTSHVLLMEPLFLLSASMKPTYRFLLLQESGCSGPPGLQKETWRSEVELLILLMGACHVGSM
jgi:hypothetical protein